MFPIPQDMTEYFGSDLARTTGAIILLPFETILVKGHLSKVLKWGNGGPILMRLNMIVPQWPRMRQKIFGFEKKFFYWMDEVEFMLSSWVKVGLWIINLPGSIPAGCLVYVL